MLNDEELERYSRQLVLNIIGKQGQLKLKNSRVCVIGLGGLGWLTSITLAGMGVGFLRLVDRDVVELSNLQRQLIYTVNDIGKSKAEAIAERLSERNPNIEIEPLALSVSLETIEEIISDIDVVVDCLDNFQARRIVNYGCIKKNVPFVYSSAIRTYGSVHTIIPNESACMECIYPDMGALEGESCAEVGVIPTILGVVSSIAAQETLNILLNKEPSLSEYLAIIDLNSVSIDKIKVIRNTNCKICGTNPI
ncbi:MAG: HesA/MoeB/ThiF family protein, partial [Candidatus Odinarchaeia archaeon]